MVKLTLYHGTSAANARKIMSNGFVPDTKYNWKIKSKKGFVYLSLAYAPFYAMASKNNNNNLALIKVTVDTKNLYPDEDFIMFMKNKPVYSQSELDKINLNHFQVWWKQSLNFLGNAAAKPKDITIKGVRYFNGKNLLMVCDPTITPMNYKFMGEHYRQLSKNIYKGMDISKMRYNI